jgi:hypothetical protein
MPYRRRRINGMKHRRTAAAADAQERLPAQELQSAREHRPGPEELPDDYAEWLDGWMFAGSEEQQEGET